MKPCFGYIRVSTQKQGEGVSLDAQKDAITVFASQNSLTITEWFEEKRTAAKRGRPVFNQMLRQLKKRKAEGLVMHKIDRSSRNLRDWTLISELPRYGVKPYFVMEGLDFETRGGRLSANLQAVIAEDYIFNLREETKKGIHGRLKQGLFPFRAPVGYLDTGRGQPKARDPKKAPLIREAFELYASRQFSLRTLLQEMNQRGLRNHDNQPLTMRGIETILNNTFYTGLITIKRSGCTFRGIHEPVVPTRLFARVQEIKAGRSGPKTTRHNHLFQGLFRCGYCNNPMTPEIQKGRTYYRCQKSGCPTATIREEQLDQAIRWNLQRLVLTEEAAFKLKAAWCGDAVTKEATQRQTSLDLRVAEQEKRLERLTDLLLDDAIDQETYRSRQADMRLRLQELKEKQADTPDVDKIAKYRREYLELMKTLCLLYEMAKPREKREIVENAFSNRVVVGKNVELEPYIWLRRPQNDLGVPNGAPARGRDTDLPGVPYGCPHLEKMFKMMRRAIENHADEGMP